MIVEGSDGATALLGLDGFVVVARDLIDGEWSLLVETTAAVVFCASCGARAVGHGLRRVRVRDVPIATRAVRLDWSKRVWRRCVDPACGAVTWSETHPAISSQASLTQRANDSLLEAQVLIEDWRIDYNEHRPHSAHGDLTPAEFAQAWTTRNQLALA